jgi:uncharacterized protein YijF (DUF1287 family)
MEIRPVIIANFLPLRFAQTVLVPLAVLLALALNAHADSQNFACRLVAGALERTQHTVRYDGSYHRIAYPNGDVPDNIGVCTDLIIRAYRSVGIDLQRLVHEDMRRAFSAYPDYWGLQAPDPNIDHRRVPNLQAFFQRNGHTLPISDNPADYRCADIVIWRLPNNLPHIGIVTDIPAPAGMCPMVVHNIGAGPQLEDVLFHFEITGHFRYDGDRKPPEG